MMMRTRGLTSPVLSKYCKIPKLAKSAGNYIIYKKLNP